MKLLPYQEVHKRPESIEGMFDPSGVGEKGLELLPVPSEASYATEVVEASFSSCLAYQMDLCN